MFLFRRIIYAFVIVFMDEIIVFGVLIVMFSCLVMLGYAISEWQWKDNIINIQHVFDECCIYVSCLFLLLFSNYVNSRIRNVLGFVFIGFILTYVVYNTIIIFIQSLRMSLMYLRRICIQCRRKRL